VARQTFFEAMRSFLLQHFLADEEMAAERQAARGAAHYDHEQYTVRLPTEAFVRGSDDVWGLERFLQAHIAAECEQGITAPETASFVSAVGFGKT